MSYILDALKKAESERNLGAVPNVYANAPHAVQADEGGRWGKILPWSVAAIALGLVLIVLAWLQPWRTQPSTVAPVVTPAPQVTQTAPVAPPPAEIAPANTPAPTAPPAVATTPAKVTEEPAQVKPVPTPIAKPSAPTIEKKIVDTTPVKEEKPIAKAEPKPEAKPEPKTEVKTVAKADVKTEAKADGSDVGTARDLPQAIQSQLPPISVNGYLYDKDPADRSVLMNQKLLREGDTVAPDLVLEKLLPKGAILNYKGYRYRIAF